jgi:hypothetical protein
MKQVDVRFNSGRDVLNAYWGYLSHGGLVIRDNSSLDVGQAVDLQVEIESSQSRYSFAGDVVKRQADGQAVIAFRPGEPHDMLITEALAETDQVPPRRHRRYHVDLTARVVSPSGGELAARVVNVSEGGCCFRVDLSNTDFDIGSNVDIYAGNFRASGRVVWTRHTERGVRFTEPDVIRRYLQTL